MYLLELFQLAKTLWLAPGAQHRVIAAPVHVDDSGIWCRPLDDVGGKVELLPLPSLQPLDRLQAGLDGVVLVRRLLEVVHNDLENCLDLLVPREPPEDVHQVRSTGSVRSGRTLTGVTFGWNSSLLHSQLWYGNVLQDVLESLMMQSLGDLAQGD